MGSIFIDKAEYYIHAICYVKTVKRVIYPIMPFINAMVIMPEKKRMPTVKMSSNAKR